ncbi:MAG: prepilin-type N-terminal cleavage/methylation domain-containing protein [Candidatus Eisenbacteria bacterium]
MKAHGSALDPSRDRVAQRGFGLIELAIAIVVLAIGVLGLAALMPMGTRSAAKSGEVTRASELASSLAERLLATPYGDPDLTNGSHQATPYPISGGYYLTWVVEDDQPIISCKRVTITIRWPSPAAANSAQLVIVSPRANDL